MAGKRDPVKPDTKKNSSRPSGGMGTRGGDGHLRDPVRTPERQTPVRSKSPEISTPNSIQQILKKLDSKLDGLDGKIEFSTNELKDKIE